MSTALRALCGLTALSLLALGAGGSACDRDEPAPIDDFDRGPFLGVVADEIVTPALDAFESRAVDLLSSTAIWVAAPDNEGTRLSAQAQWRLVSSAWQRLEVLQLGPLGAAGVATGGESLRDEVYSWPLVSNCGVDQQLVANEFEQPDFIATKLVNVYGLDALEYLLFDEDETNACAGPATINTDGSWDALVASGLTERRADYAHALAGALVEQAAQLKSAWAGFSPQFKAAGEDGTGFVNAQAAVDEVFAALFYLELRVKDRKLAVPAGLHIDCATETCPELVESPFAQHSVAQIRVNLQATRDVFTGGFDDMLEANNATELSARMLTNLDAAIAAADAFEGTLTDALPAEALPEGKARVVALHDAIKVFTDDLKADFVTVLNLRVPQEGAGDND